jgi:DNA-directed RNA polymerase specialized sigma24 family protein
LPPRDRRLLTLYAFGHTHREIGARFDQPVHRVGPSIARALARLRRSLNRLN